MAIRLRKEAVSGGVIIFVQLAAPPFIADAGALAANGTIHGRNAVRFGVVNAAVGAGRAWVRVPIRATPVAINELIRRNARRAILVGLASAAWADHRRLQAKKRAKSGPRSKWPGERKLEALEANHGRACGGCVAKTRKWRHVGVEGVKKVGRGT